jgi:hypothetical protein
MSLCSHSHRHSGRHRETWLRYNPIMCLRPNSFFLRLWGTRACASQSVPDEILYPFTWASLHSLSLTLGTSQTFYRSANLPVKFLMGYRLVQYTLWDRCLFWRTFGGTLPSEWVYDSFTISKSWTWTCSESFVSRAYNPVNHACRCALS